VIVVLEDGDDGGVRSSPSGMNRIGRKRALSLSGTTKRGFCNRLVIDQVATQAGTCLNHGSRIHRLVVLRTRC
jgi:hypothetical protein